MPVSESYTEYILDQLSEFGDVDTKRMFGGVGIFKEGRMFGMIENDRFRLKTDDFNRNKFVQRGLTPFMAAKGKKGLPYYEVPVEILEDKDQLKVWAMESYEAALRAARK